MTKNLKIIIALNTLIILGSFSFPVFSSEANYDTQSIVDRINILTNDILTNNTLNTSKSNNISKDQYVLGTQNTQEEKSIERKELMKELMKEDPILFNNIAMNSSDRDTLPSNIKDNIEQQSIISGKITTINIDDANKTSSYQYYINTPQKQYSFYPTSDAPLLSSTNVQVTGYTLDSQLSANTKDDPVTVLGTEPPTNSTGDQRTLIILIKSFPEDNEPFTAAQAQNLVFNSQFQNFMKEQSYNKVSFSGDVYGWMSTGQNLKIVNNVDFFNRPSVGDLLSRAVNTYGIDITKYDRVAYLTQDISGGLSSIGKTYLNVNNNSYLLSYSIIGLGYPSSNVEYYLPSAWGAQPFTWTNLDFLLSHELGHALGVVHASSWTCTDGQILYGNCSYSEYGNHYDTMGTTSYSLNYNAYFKEKLGWIPDSQMIPITSSGTYTINPLEIPDSPKLGAKVYVSGRTPNPYYLELRKALGFDANLNNTNPNLTNNQNGIFVNYVRPNNYPELLDMSPSNDLTNATLNLSSSGTSVPFFTDSQTGVTIGPVLSVSDLVISFNVNFTAVTPISTPIAGTYDTAQTISLSSSESTYIKYTIDGSTPSCTEGTTYSTPIIVSSSETIKATGCDSLNAPSPVATFVYIINDAPTVSNVIISGTPSVDQILTGSYTYADTEGDLEDASTFRWLRNDTIISGATSSAYTTTIDDAGKIIKFEVKPIALTGSLNGLVVQSTGISIPAVAPVVTTDEALVISPTSATLNANIASSGGSLIIVSGFKYGLTTDYTTTTTDGTITTSTYSKPITNLICNTTYHYLAYATNSINTTLGNDQSFTTNECPIILSNISITTPPSKLSYKVGESLDIAGLVVTGTYSDNSTKQETITNENITGFNSATPITNQTITISIGDKTTIFTIKIVKNSTSRGGGGGGSSRGGNSSTIIPTPIPPTTIPVTQTEECRSDNLLSSTNEKPCITSTVPIIVTQPLNTGLLKYNLGTTILKNGSRGENVKELQRFLNNTLNLGLVVDGILGPKTIAVIKQWQKNNNLIPDGLVGPKTKAMINKQTIVVK